MRELDAEASYFEDFHPSTISRFLRGWHANVGYDNRTKISARLGMTSGQMEDAVDQAYPQTTDPGTYEAQLQANEKERKVLAAKRSKLAAKNGNHGSGQRRDVAERANDPYQFDLVPALAELPPEATSDPVVDLVVRLAATLNRWAAAHIRRETESVGRRPSRRASGY